MLNRSLLPMIFVFFSWSVAHAQQAATVSDSSAWKVKVEEVALYKDQGIPFLKWSREVFMVDNSALVNYANLSGKFGEKVIGATVNGRRLTVSDDGKFAFRLEFMGEEKSFIITVTTAQNKVHRMQYKIGQVTREIQGIGVVRTPWRWRFSGGLGYTYISYRQFNSIAFNQNVITIKGGVVYRAVPQVLDLGLTSFYNLLPLSSSSTAGYKIQYMGVNVRAGYHVIEAPSSLRFIMNAGMYFNSSSGEVGFANMYGPQISPEFTYVLDNGHSIFWYFKYAHSLSGASGISLKNNREVATGVHYSLPVSESNRLSLGIDLSQLSLSLDTKWASTNTYSFSAGLSF